MNNQTSSISTSTDDSSKQLLPETSNWASECSVQELTQKPRIAWLYPTSGLAFYLQPVIREFTKIFPETTFFTGKWPGYVPGCENSFKVQVVGESKFIPLSRNKTGYTRGITWVPLNIVPVLLEYNPDIVFVNAFSLWTLFVLLLKPFKKWRVVLIYSGSSPNVDMIDSKLRLVLRHNIVQFVDAAITNSQAGKNYLTNALHLDVEKVFAGPYQMPDKQALLQITEPKKMLDLECSKLTHPIFLFIGQTVYRKGISFLIEACSILEKQGECNYTVLVIGDGAQRKELETLTEKQGLSDRIKWLGWVEYGGLGYYFQNSDIFVFPTLEDIWGMVVLEAMLFEKPVICSKWAGALELLKENENGYIFNPYHPEELAESMHKFIRNPESINNMGRKSSELISFFTPKKIAENLSKVAEFVLID